jgi:hypothetical protein
MVHVEVRKEQVIYTRYLTERQFGQTAIATIKQQPRHSLATVDRDQGGIVASGGSEDLEM